MKRRIPSSGSGRSRWAVLGFLAGATIIVVLVLVRYLAPAARASYQIDATGRRQLAALSALVLAVVLVLLVAGLILIVRPGRFFFPRWRGQRTRTRYVDAWSESARRLDNPPREE